MCVTLIFILLALNVLMFAAVPDYTMYGSQHYMVRKEQGLSTARSLAWCPFPGLGKLEPGTLGLRDPE